MDGRLCGRSAKFRMSSATGELLTRPAVTNVSWPPSGRLAVERYRSAPKLRRSVGCQLAFSPYRKVSTLRFRVLFTISGWKLFTDTEVMVPLVTTALFCHGVPSG